MNNSKSSTKIAQYLLETGAVKFNPEDPFIWASGIESPIYCDNRVLLSYPNIREAIIDDFVSRIKESYPSVEAIAGVATAGIAHGVLIASRMELPFAYVRPEPKKHGMKNQIEGKLLPQSKVVVIEDLISTGMSSLKAVKALRESDVEVLGLASIFTYGFKKSQNAFRESSCDFFTLAVLNDLLEAALEMNYLNEAQVEKTKTMLMVVDN
jgi:orotate phosphoribosyltransferase